MTDANKLAQTLAERGSRYGDFSDHARICQAIKYAMYTEDGWSRLTAVQKQALEVIADKMGRILSGDPDYADNWHDIQGYAKLAEDRLPPEFGQQNTIDYRRAASDADRSHEMLMKLAEEAKWDAAEARMDVVGQNCPTAEHYDEVPNE